MLIRLRLLDPGRVRLRIAVRTLAAAVAALLVSGAIGRAAGLPGGMVVIATVVAVMVSRSLHATSLPHRLSALVHVPLVGLLAAFVGRLMVQSAWCGAAVFVGAVGGSRYLMRFGGKVRRFGRLALTPLIAVLVTPVPPSAAKATGPLWGAVCGVIAVACVLASQIALPSRPTREAAAAAGDFVRAAARLRALAPGTAAHAKAAAALHRTALTVEDRLDAARLPDGTDRAPLDTLAAAVLTAEVAARYERSAAPRHGTKPAASGEAAQVVPAQEPFPRGQAASERADSDGADSERVAAERFVRTPAVRSRAGDDEPAAPGGAMPGPAGEVTPGPAGEGTVARDEEAHSASGAAPSSVPDAVDIALGAVRSASEAVRRVRSVQEAAPDVPAPAARPGGWRNPQPQARLSAQLVVAMAAAFTAGHLIFPRHWTWTVITAFVVCSAARGRGDVVHRSGLRVAGAFTGAVTGTLVAHEVAGDHVAAIAVIFCYLLVGLWLRETTYAVWAFCVTSLLAVLNSLNGEQGGALIVQRPEGILLGSACGIAAAYFVLPLPTTLVLRGRAGNALRVLQDLLAAAREPEPRPAAVRHLARRFDRAVRELAVVAAPARAHRTLTRRALGHSARAARRAVPARPHDADWVDALATCAHAARSLALCDAHTLAAARPQLGLAALNLGQVRRRLGRRPDATPPRPARTGPAAVVRLDAALGELYDLLPAPAADPAPPASPPPSEPAPAAAG
ncbi:Fusaric acid resistance protein-like [Actinacidiphila yanglinensis]|uniref:Fusaric acid resistance protein-like n=1 Tax=Actinacidiphila yanglinensis TaxID=310779 RepID=A0A1H5ZBZ5_9ACTN|nr:FUSC family protein [Actinacidiphila yanglinensis]SEG33560.1 Fusaric acid resistance protein-like [Actinacidiphila yanglinensis]